VIWTRPHVRTSARPHVLTSAATTTFALLLLLAASAFAQVTAADLSRVENQSTVELTTMGRKSGQPRAVTIWFVRDDAALYVQAGKGGKTDWYRNLLAKPEVGLRFDGLTVRGKAKPVDDAAETKRIHQLFADKYFSARVMGWFGGGFGHGKVVRVESLQAEAK
jgi:deazaflavin-dependent oxidoreductase (nitroreductase family)